MRLSRLTLFVCLGGAPGIAQISTGPVLGWTIAPGGEAVHTIHGIPGASRLGAARQIPSGLWRLTPSPASNLGAARDEESGAPVLVDLESFERTTLDGARPGPASFVWSPTGKALAVVYPEQRWIQVFATERGGYRLKNEIGVVADRFAISDSGLELLAQSGDELLLHTASAAAIVARGAISGFGFLAGSDTATYWHDGNLVVGSVILQFPKDPSEEVMLSSPARGTLLAIRSGSGVVIVFDASGAVTGEARCDCPVSSVEPLGRAGAVRLSSGDGPLWVVSASADPRLFFIPGKHVR